MLKSVGTRDEVWEGRAIRTRGGLQKEDLMVSKRGRIVSRAQSEAAKARFPVMLKALCAKRHPCPACPGATAAAAPPARDLVKELNEYRETSSERVNAMRFIATEYLKKVRPQGFSPRLKAEVAEIANYLIHNRQEKVPRETLQKSAIYVLENELDAAVRAENIL